MKTFEEFLQEKHAEIYPTVLDDDGPDHLDNWIGGLDVQEVIDLAGEAVGQAYLAGFDHGAKIALAAMTSKTYEPTN